MNERDEAKSHEVGERPFWVSWNPLAGQVVSREAEGIHTDPRQVVEDPAFTVAEKREILASWACDSRAPHDCPSLRVIDSGAVVGVDEILDALKSLDQKEHPTENHEQRWPRRPYARGGRGLRDASLRRRPRSGDSEDDDDPPPCPVRSRPPGPILPPLTVAATAPRYEPLPEDALGRPMTPDTEPWRQRSKASAG